MKHAQKQPLYLTTSIGNLDNLVDLTDWQPKTFDAIEDALEDAKAEAAEDGLRVYVYKCIPIYQVDRGLIRVKKLRQTKGGDEMPRGDKKGPPSGARGPKSGQGGGQGRAPGAGTGQMTGGKRNQKPKQKPKK
jgi:hypothetical protein